jgi:hypothetical protein
VVFDAGKAFKPGDTKSIYKMKTDLMNYNINLELLIFGVVGLGDNILFRVDTWVGDAPFCSKNLALYASEKQKMVRVSHCFQLQLSTITWTWRQKIDLLTNDEQDQFNQLC